MFPHEFPFDPTYGYRREALLQIAPPPIPSDFDDFWRETCEQAREQPLELEMEEVESARPHHRVRILYFRTLGGLRVGAWLVTPKNERITGAAVVSHGYGGRDAPDFDRRHVANLFVCAPGFNLSAAPGLPSNGSEHVVHGIQTRESYLIRHCVAALWSGARVLTELYPELHGQLRYSGGSFGGGLGALALPWDESFARAFLDVPTFGHHPIRLRCACVGSGEAVRLYRESHPEVDQVLPYFDAAIAATRIRIPVYVACALFDPAVPPPGMFAVYNALAGPRELYVKSAAHFIYPMAAREGFALGRHVNGFLWSG